MHVSNILGIAGAASGLLSAGLWVHASMLAWKLGRQGGGRATIGPAARTRPCPPTPLRPTSLRSETGTL